MQAGIMTWLVLFAPFGLSVFCFWVIINDFYAIWKQKDGMNKLIRTFSPTLFDDLLVAQEYLRTLFLSTLLD